MTHQDAPAFLRFPPYTHVPGVTPHPVSHPSGHSYNIAEASAGWTNAEHLLCGRHLFDRGFYWEAHEAWEQLWIQLGRKGPEADLVKGLIKLAACGVKCLECNVSGAVRHAKRAAELLRQDVQSPLLTGSDFEFFRNLSQQVAANPPVLTCPSTGEPTVIFAMSDGWK